MVVLVGPGQAEALSPEAIDAALREALLSQAPGAAAADVAKSLGLSRQDLYRRALALRTGT